MNTLLTIAGAGFLAGSMNAIAGGGSFVTLPVLVAMGVPSLNANASSTVALVPSALASGYAYRKQFSGFANVSLKAMAAVSVLGGALGAFLLLSTPQSMFNLLLPWLLLVGSLTFSFGRKAGEWLRQRVRIGPNTMLAAQFLLGVYGGYFGGAVGIMMLATWSLITTADLGSMQASRNVLNAAMNATASLIFIFGGLVYWPQMFALMAGALVGGYGAAWFATRLDPAKARVGISIMTGLITLLFFWKTYFA